MIACHGMFVQASFSGGFTGFFAQTTDLKLASTGTL